tara:strand:- start:753 stop:1070 length:318 start_codon:yes stop_codon:yes gene_type:complete
MDFEQMTYEELEKALSTVDVDQISNILSRLEALDAKENLEYEKIKEAKAKYYLFQQTLDERLAPMYEEIDHENTVDAGIEIDTLEFWEGMYSSAITCVETREEEK